MDLQSFLALDNANMIAPVGLSFGLHDGNADLFLLMIIGDQDSPLRVAGRILIFENENECRTALERLEPLLPEGVKALHKYDFLCDLRTAIELITTGEYDRDAVVLNCINTVVDLVATGDCNLPTEYKILETLGDQLTFQEGFGESGAMRVRLRDALLWCAGSTLMSVRIVRTLTEFDSIIPILAAGQRSLPSIEGRIS